MKDWTYSFETVTTSEWKKQIETDLKGRPLSSIYGTWWEDELLDPLIRYDDKEEPVCLPDHLFKRPPVLTEQIQVGKEDDPNAINRLIIDCLAAGCQRIVIKALIQNFSPVWIQDVLPEAASVCIEPSNPTLEDMKNSLETLSSSVHIRIPLSPGMGIKDKLSLLGSGRQRQLFFQYEIPESGQWVSGTAGALNILVRDLRQWIDSGQSGEDFFNRVVLRMKPSGDYMLQLIQCRVLRLIMLNLAGHYTEDHSKAEPEIELCIPSLPNEESDRFLIRASIYSLAASMSGVSSLLIDGTAIADPHGMYRRVSRNIHHLLHLESNMYKGKDPVSGAYIPDHYTRKWSSDIWGQLEM